MKGQGKQRPTQINPPVPAAEAEPDDDGLISAEKFRADHSLAPTTFYRMLADGELKAVKVRRRTMIRKSEARRWLASLPDFKPGAGV
ncbi:MAG: helix-turn-helix domain-containing protein [Alphaproteobacteria bacterium]|jgi:excisionase family DNA binding protein|nr:helix-turn-helix domain-containing protein [Alphaproteobacteria bacterium]